GWALRVEVLKRKGPPLDRALTLSAPPAGLPAVWPARLAEAGRSLSVIPSEAGHAVVRAEAIEHRRTARFH
ncbi:MAG: translesion DNA synthesis-associated protein ImuA, partial [Hydrogenophaga sp.]